MDIRYWILGRGKMSNLVFPQLDLVDKAYQRLQMRLDVYDEVIFCRRIGADGEFEAGYLVDPLELAAAFAGIDLSTPLLPKNTLFWSRSGGEECVGIFVSPETYRLVLAKDARVGDETTLVVPLPGLVFVGRGTRYFLFAVKVQGGGWPNLDEGLFRAPLPNVHYNIRGEPGKVCWGSAKPPAASAGTIWQALGLFFESEFNRHLDEGKSQAEPEDVLTFLRGLDGKKKYPVGDLVPLKMKLRELIK